MPKNIYIIRHCKAEGQSPEAPLTELGFMQAKQLAKLFNETSVERIVSSPFLRAIQSVEPVSRDKKIDIELDSRLSERILSTKDMPDWLPKLKETFLDLDLNFEGGETSREAMMRIVEVVEEVFKSSSQNTVIVSHGNIISLLLKNYDKKVDFDSWKNLSNPDVFKLSSCNGEYTIERIWIESRNH